MIYFADTQSLATLGIPGLLAVIGVLSTVVVLLYNKANSLQVRIDGIQEQRITDARETRDKVMEPLQKQATMSEKTYDLLLNFTSRGQ